MTESRGLGIPQGTAMTIGAVLGTGVLTLPALAAQVAGPASLVAWFALVLISIPLAATFAGLGARHPDGGGVATYARLAFGRRAATVVGWWFYLGVTMGAPPAAGFAGSYVADLLGGGRTTQIATATVLIAVVVGLNWFGIRISGRLQLVIAGALALLLAISTLVALPHVDLANLRPFVPYGWGAVGAAAALLVWAFAGWEAVASLSGEYANPEREIRIVTAAALVVIGVLYLGVAFAVVAVLGPNPSNAPLSDLLALGFGPRARPVTTIVAVLLSLGAMNAYLASASRLGAALGRDGSLPSWWAVTHAGVPRRSLVVVATLATATLVVVGASGLPLESTLLLVTGAFTLVYVIGTAAATKLLPRWSLVWWCAVVSLVATAILAILTGAHMGGAIAIAIGALLYTVATRRQA
ncbi:MAG TPA: amino acid permease [Propionibacteriaceae bacterium]|nr:amino acid permease [Propionibacteriaceae bacterium]